VHCKLLSPFSCWVENLQIIAILECMSTAVKLTFVTKAMSTIVLLHVAMDTKKEMFIWLVATTTRAVRWSTSEQHHLQG